ncbi:MAG: hypothetical protein ABSG91_02885 [Syntrophobacteraceae bacterium]|jgi:hypothetical protein
MAWKCPECGSSCGEGLDRCYCGFERQQNNIGPVEEGQAGPKTSRSGIILEVFVFIAFNILWVIFHLAKKTATPFRKVLARTLLAVYIIAGGLFLWAHKESPKPAAPQIPPPAAPQIPPAISAPQNKQPAAPAPPKTDLPLKFVTNEKSVRLNGNLRIAIDRLKEVSPNSIWAAAQDSPPSKITSRPFSFLGSLVKLSGQIYKIEQLPSDDVFRGNWYEILISTPNTNDPLGMTTIELLYKGDASRISSRSNLTCAGYFVGTSDFRNAVGGQVEALVIVGNAIQSTNPARPRYPFKH